MNSISDKLIKILSLGIGLAIGIVLIAKVCFELSYDSFYKDVDRIYIIQTGLERQGESESFGKVSGAVAPGFKTEVPGVESATRTTFYFGSNRYMDENGHVITATCAWPTPVSSRCSTARFWLATRRRFWQSRCA